MSYKSGNTDYIRGHLSCSFYVMVFILLCVEHVNYISFSLSGTSQIHTGKKPYQCKICAYKGAKKGNVQAHVRKVHNITNDVVTVNEYVIEHLDEIERLGKP